MSRKRKEDARLSPESADTAAVSMRLEDQLCFALYACSREITRSYQPVLKAMNLTYTQYLTMLVLWEQDDLTVKELGARLYLDSGTLTPLLKKLENAGLLTRTRDREDERSVRIALTDKGRELREQGACVPPQVFGMTRVPAAKLMELYRLSHELMADLQSSERVD